MRRYLRLTPSLGGTGVVLMMGAAAALAMQWQGYAAPPVHASNGTSAPVAAAGLSPDAQTPGMHWSRERMPARPAAQPPAARPAAPTRPSSAPSVPTIAIGSYQQVLINQDRAHARLRALSWNSCLYAVALANARRMAAQGYISHTNGPQLDLRCGLGVQAGENVGWWSGGINDSQLNSMFMASPDHRANITGPYRFVATAWVVAANGYAYVAVEFG